MSCCVYHEEGNIKIRKENMKLILTKLSDFFNNGGELKWVDGFDIKDMISIEDDEDTPLTLEEIWNDLKYELEEDDNYYTIIDFIGEKLGDDDVLFKLIAPYCEDGYLQFHTDNGEHFRFVIKDGKFEEKNAGLSWE
ncbi:hypothetical protein ACYJ2U_001649 [Clostridium botulinum]